MLQKEGAAALAGLQDKLLAAPDRSAAELALALQFFTTTGT
jgi:hypothetical protein